MMVITAQGLRTLPGLDCTQRMLGYVGRASRNTGVKSSRRFDQYVKDRKPWRVFGTVILQ